jgi:diacylglycerol kinase family enzyme
MRLNFFWHAVVWVALAVYALLVFLGVILLARNLGFALLLGGTATWVLYAAWLVFTGSGGRARKGRWYLGAGMTILIVELVIFIRNRDGWRALVALLLLTAVYFGLASLLRNKYWREQRQAHMSSSGTMRFRRPYLIINPKSGNGRAVKARVDELARAAGVEVTITKKGDDIGTIAEQAAQDGIDVLGVSGGDGTIGAVAKVALEHKLPVVILPGGTRCHLARDLGMDPKHIADALAGFYGVERRIDVADINGRIFLNNASFGLYADIVDSPGYREHKLQAARGVLRALLSGEKDLYDLRFRHGKAQIKQAAQVLVGVNRYKTLELFEIGRREQLDGGVLQVTAITGLNDVIVRHLLRTVSIDKIRHGTNLSELLQWDAKSFRITSGSSNIVAGVDGEREVYATPVNIRIHPGALRVFVPAEGVRGRPKSVFSFYIVRRIWRAVARKDT